MLCKHVCWGALSRAGCVCQQVYCALQAGELSCTEVCDVS